jgi:hypothetical protein
MYVHSHPLLTVLVVISLFSVGRVFAYDVRGSETKYALLFSMRWLVIIMNSDGHQLHQHQQNEQSHHTSKIPAAPKC